jgi:hypothetical protein
VSHLSLNREQGRMLLFGRGRSAAAASR